MSDRRAEAERGKACELTWRDGMEDAATWLRTLHASHIPEPGAFSVCVHRKDAATVSYTQVHCGDKELRMAYSVGNPCKARELPDPVRLPLDGLAADSLQFPKVS
jgi:hypothetical protein